MRNKNKLAVGTVFISASVLGLIVVSTSPSYAQPDRPAAAGHKLCSEIGIAAHYPEDAGIANDPDVIFADDFELWKGDGTKKPEDKWHSIRINKMSRTRAVPGKVTIDNWQGSGERVLEIACWHTGGGGTGGIALHLGNYANANEGLGDGYEEIYIRYYLKFNDNYKVVRNHGANLGGRDLTQKDAAWVGQAGFADVAAKGYFFSGVQPTGPRGSRDIHMKFYSYHMDKKGQWGDGYEILKKIPLQPGRWYCVERHMKLNSVNPLQADGIEELWVDGELSIHREGLRFRRLPQLRITFFSLETYYHGLEAEYGRENPIRVYFDNVVIARKYIGPMTPAPMAAVPAPSKDK